MIKGTMAALFAAASMVAVAPAALADDGGRGSKNGKNGYGQHYGNGKHPGASKKAPYGYGKHKQGSRYNNGYHGYHGKKSYGHDKDDDRDDDRGRDDDGKKGKYGGKDD